MCDQNDYALGLFLFAADYASFGRLYRFQRTMPILANAAAFGRNGVFTSKLMSFLQVTVDFG